MCVLANSKELQDKRSVIRPMHRLNRRHVIDTRPVKRELPLLVEAAPFQFFLWA
jgi:hypothetical protein